MDIRSQDFLEKLNFYYGEIRKITDFEPEIALVLGMEERSVEAYIAERMDA